MISYSKYSLLVIRDVLHNYDIWICWCVYYVSHKVHSNSLWLSKHVSQLYKSVSGNFWWHILLHQYTLPQHYIFFKTIETCVWLFILGIYSFGNFWGWISIKSLHSFLFICTMWGWMEKKRDEFYLLHLNFYFNTLFPWPT